ncbi:MAG: hypothetical protein IPP83_11535 [Flavobacteriales bacterium]|nr:hypothetical protein [Flavobacteriales bacterium]
MSPTRIGSVGSATPIPPRESSSRLMDSGVANAMKSRSRCGVATIAQITNSTAGSTLNQ